MHRSIIVAVVGAVMFYPSLANAEAKKRWVSNPGLNTPDYNQSLPLRPRSFHPPRYPNYPPQSGIYIHYRAPQTVQHHRQQQVWINGELVEQRFDQGSQFYSANFEVISNWRAVGLPAPPHGMFWISSGGRYMLQSQH